MDSLSGIIDENTYSKNDNFNFFESFMDFIRQFNII